LLPELKLAQPHTLGSRIDMANDKPKADAAPPAGKKSRLPLIIIAVVVIVGGAAGIWLALKPKPAAPAAAAAAEVRAPPKAAPIYYKFDPPFVVNFGQEGATRYLQLTLEAMSRDAAVIDEIKNNEPAVRNDLVLLYSAQQYETLISPAGKEQLRADTLAAIRKVLAAEGGNAAAVEAVYFTSFVIQ
jgi:flagellar FliL protein